MADCGCCGNADTDACGCNELALNIAAYLHPELILHPNSAIRTLYATVSEWFDDDCLCHNANPFFPGGVAKTYKYPVTIGTVFTLNAIPYSAPYLKWVATDPIHSAPDDVGTTYDDMLFVISPCGPAGNAPVPTVPPDPFNPNKVWFTYAISPLTPVVCAERDDDPWTSLTILSCRPFVAQLVCTSNCGDSEAGSRAVIDITE